MDSLIATYIVAADGTGTAAYFLDGLEISAGEYDAIQIAAMNRALDGEA